MNEWADRQDGQDRRLGSHRTVALMGRQELTEGRPGAAWVFAGLKEGGRDRVGAFILGQRHGELVKA
jgi:hypothetical protein